MNMKYRSRKRYGHGGNIDDKKAMILSQIKEVHHHADELAKVVAKMDTIDAWVVGKMERATTDLSDITHYLDGTTEYAKGGMMAKGGRSLMSMANLVVKDELKNTKLKNWYTKKYPTDDLGEEISATATFKDLWDCLHNNGDVYKIIGVGDSVIRERLFDQISEMTGHSDDNYVTNLYYNYQNLPESEWSEYPKETMAVAEEYVNPKYISHYKIKNTNEIFVSYDDAMNYCDKNNLPYSAIIKTKKYAEGGMMSDNTFDNILMDYGFKKTKTFSGKRFFSNGKNKDIFASVDDKLREVRVETNDNTIYSGYSIADLMYILKQNRNLFLADGGMMANGGRVLVGKFDEQQLRNKEDKKAVEKAQKETGLKYIDSKIVKKGGKMMLEVYLISDEEYHNSSKFADGGMMADGGEVRYKLKGNNFGDQIENGRKFKVLIEKAFNNQSGETYPLNFISETAFIGKIVKHDGKNYLKDYSYKGTLSKFDFLDDKDFIEALKYVDRPAIRKFEDGGIYDYDEYQASEQGYWDTESTLNHIKDELKLNNINFNVRPNIPEENIAMIDINSSNKFSDRITLTIQDGIVYINDKEFNLNEDNTLVDIINHMQKYKLTMKRGGRTRGSYTYVPKEFIDTITTSNDVEFDNKDILDGTYIKGKNRKFALGGSTQKKKPRFRVTIFSKVFEDPNNEFYNKYDTKYEYFDDYKSANKLYDSCIGVSKVIEVDLDVLKTDEFGYDHYTNIKWHHYKKHKNA